MGGIFQPLLRTENAAGSPVWELWRAAYPEGLMRAFEVHVLENWRGPVNGYRIIKYKQLWKQLSFIISGMNDIETAFVGDMEVRNWWRYLWHRSFSLDWLAQNICKCRWFYDIFTSMGKNCYCVVCHYFVIVRVKRRRVLVTNETCVGHVRVLVCCSWYGLVCYWYSIFFILACKPSPRRHEPFPRAGNWYHHWSFIFVGMCARAKAEPQFSSLVHTKTHHLSRTAVSERKLWDCKIINRYVE